MPMMMATMIRTILRALLLPAGGGATGTGVGTDAGVAGDAPTGGRVLAMMGTPHLLQNRVPGTIVAPQELQNAINHLVQNRNF